MGYLINKFVEESKMMNTVKTIKTNINAVANIKATTQGWVLTGETKA